MDEAKRKEASRVMRKMREAGGRVVLEENDVPRMARALDNLMSQEASGGSDMAKALNTLAETLAKQQTALDRMAVAITARKRLVKDADGKIEGVETIMPSESDTSLPPMNVIIEGK